MPYHVFVFVALTIHILINFNMFYKNENAKAIKEYRLFAIAIALFYLTDALWGSFEKRQMNVALYVDTFIYFVLMGSTILLWTRFVIKYIEGNKIFSNVVKYTGVLFFVTEIVLVIVNIFTPILFTVDENTVYKSYIARDIMLYAQIAMYSLVFLFSSIYTLTRKIENFRRYIAVSLFSVVMIVCISIQLGDPYLPFYSIGLLIGVCILETYVLNETKEVFRSAYQKTSKINEENKEKLDAALVLAYTDPLTGVKSKHAYVEMEEKYDKLILENKIDNFAVVVFDLNGLKEINDTRGHDAGDAYIIESVNVIAKYFPFDNIYRFGGDEFVAILEGKEYEDRQKIHNDFMDLINQNVIYNDVSKPVISSGISRFKKGVDNTYHAVFYRADKMMYTRKDYLKEHHN